MSRRRPPLYALTRARVLEFIREPEAVFWVFAFPVIMALVLGFAFRDKAPEKLPIGVAGEARPGRSRGSAPRARRLSTRSRSRPSRRGSRRCAPGRSPCSSRTASPSSTTSIRRGPTRASPASRWTTRSSAPPAGGISSRIREEEMHEKGSRYIDFLLPGILGLNLMGTGIWGIGFGIVNARLKKTLKLLTATPMRKSDYLLAQILSRLFFLAPRDRGDPRSSASSPSGVPIRGSLPLLPRGRAPRLPLLRRARASRRGAGPDARGRRAA